MEIQLPKPTPSRTKNIQWADAFEGQGVSLPRSNENSHEEANSSYMTRLIKSRSNQNSTSFR